MKSPAVWAALGCGIGTIVLGTSAPHQVHEAGALRSEVVGLRAHFDSVLAELTARDISHLAPRQQAARSEVIRVLARYRDADRFPHNHDFPGERVPYFRDAHRTLCAMAYLVAATGRRDIVDAVAERRNNAYIRELSADPRLGAWLDSVGLTVAEAARIQPTYDGPTSGIFAEGRYPPRYVVPSLGFGLPALLTAVLNWRAPRERSADATLYGGALAGAASVMTGGWILTNRRDGPMRTLGFADVAVGSVAFVAALRRSARLAGGSAPRPPVATNESRLSVDVVPSRHAGRIAPAARVQVRF